MKKQLATPLLLITLLAVYDFLFWNEGIGINFPIFILLLIAVLICSFPHFNKVRIAIGMLFLAALAAVLVAITNTGLSKVTAFVMGGNHGRFCSPGFIAISALRYWIRYSQPGAGAT